PPDLLGGDEQLLDPLGFLGMAVAPLARGVRGETDRADRVALPEPQQRDRHRDVLVDAREGQRLNERGRSSRGREWLQLPPLRDPTRRAAEHEPELLVVEARELR